MRWPFRRAGADRRRRPPRPARAPPARMSGADARDRHPRAEPGAAPALTDLIGPTGAWASLPEHPCRARPRPRGRRHPVLHLRHDGEAEGRHRHPPGGRLDGDGLSLFGGAHGPAQGCGRPGPIRTPPAGGPAGDPAVPRHRLPRLPRQRPVWRAPAGGDDAPLGPQDALDLVEAEGCTTAGGVPTIAWQLAEAAHATVAPCRAWTRSPTAAPPPPRPRAPSRRRLPEGRARDGWGMTETSATFTHHQGEDYIAIPDPAGRPCRSARSASAISSAATCRRGRSGLCVRGPGIVRGYWDAPEATAETFRDGWLHTGDLAVADAEASSPSSTG